MTRLDVIIDKPCVASWRVKTLPQILEEDRHKHCSDGQANQCQARCRVSLADKVDRTTSRLGRISCHSKPLRIRFSSERKWRNFKLSVLPVPNQMRKGCLSSKESIHNLQLNSSTACTTVATNCSANLLDSG